MQPALVRNVLFILVTVGLHGVSSFRASDTDKKHHGHHHKHHKHHHKAVQNATSAHKDDQQKTLLKTASVKTEKHAEEAAKKKSPEAEAAILARMKKLEEDLAAKEREAQAAAEGKILVNGPLPADFSERFIQAAAGASDCNTVEIQVLEVVPVGAKGDIAEVIFKAPKDVVMSLEHQAADPASKLANSPLRTFLMARDDDAAPASSAALLQGARAPTEENDNGEASSIDVDTAMPYGELEPFGREDTAQELTESSVKESDEMVDQLERAEVAEEKRSVFRALTRLRGAAITSFDGIARSQTGNIDEYNKVHQWRSTHPLHHLADEEADISKWAFPDNAD